jgi:hypothetical protein
MRLMMKNDREKEIKYLMYLKNELIRETKKELKDLRSELDTLNNQKTLRRKRGGYSGRRN